MSELREQSIDDLVAQLREHVAGDERIQVLLDELEVRLLRHAAYLARSRWVLAALLHEASRADGRGEETHEMFLEQVGHDVSDDVE